MPTAQQTAQQMYDAYLQAELAILAGKEVRLGGVGLDRWLKLEDLDMVQAGRKEWERKLAQANQAASNVPRFGGARFSLADVSNPGDW